MFVPIISIAPARSTKPKGPWLTALPAKFQLSPSTSSASRRTFPGPYLVKVDVQGAELAVLRGAQKALLHTDVVLLEVSLLGMLLGGPQLFDVVSAMKQFGFVVYDIWGFNYRPFDGALCQIDMAFVREHGPFRKHDVFATPEQRQAMNGTLNQGSGSITSDVSRAVTQ